MNSRTVALGVAWILVPLLTWQLWQWRFFRAPGGSTTNLPALLGDTASEGHLALPASGMPPKTISAFLAIPGNADYLHVSSSIRAEHLVKEHEDWTSGRQLLAWRDAAGDRLEWVPLGSAEGSEHFPRIELVVPIPKAAVAAELVFQNPAESGTFHVDSLVLTPVAETVVWKVGKWILGALWILNALFLVRALQPAGSWPRQALVAVAWTVLMAWTVFPGSWRPYRPLPGGFAIRHEVLPAAPWPVLPAVATRQLPPPEAVSRHDAPIVSARESLRAIRPLLHAAFFGLVAAGIAALTNVRAGFVLAALVGVSVEAIQLGYGFGADLEDLFDVLANFAGISLCLLACRKLPAILRSRFRFLQPGPEKRRAAGQQAEG